MPRAMKNKPKHIELRLMTDPYKILNSVLENAGVSKTIYSLVLPETEATIDRILDGGVQRDILAHKLQDIFNAGAPIALAQQLTQALSTQREIFRDMYREAWTQKQDVMHEDFFTTWKNWTSPIINAQWDDFPYMYPTAGASEALREAINSYATTSHARAEKPVIHVFIGEYEGFSAYADAAGIEVQTHSRADWKDAMSKIGPNEQFYISQPSAIDGNVWDDFDDFANALNTQQPSAEIMLDVTYVGCVGREFSVNATHSNIPAVFFSLSKPCGAYYHRIGGMLSKEEYPGLFGNKWFKNLLALNIGTEIMKNNGVHDLPRKYSATQQQALAQTNKTLGLNLKASDVYLLGTTPPSKEPSDLERYLTRGSDGEELVRVCLTPTMSSLIDPNTNSVVRARPHEGLKL